MTKLLPYYLYQIDAIESWLDDQAKKGLFLTDVRSRMTMGFEKGEPHPVRYRIDVKREAGTRGEEERIASYHEFGWEYVCELAGDLDIYRCDDPAAPELNTDEETLHEVLDKKLRPLAILGYASTGLLPLLSYYIILRNMRDYTTGMYDRLLNGDSWLYLFVGLIVLSWLISVGTYIAGAVATKRRMLLKRTYHSPAELRRWRTVQLSSIVLPVAALVILLASGAAMAQPDKVIPLNEFPAPSVSEVFSGVSAETQRAMESPELLRDFAYLRQEGPNVTDPQTGTLVGSWCYDVDIYRIVWQWLSDGYVQEYARAYQMHEITVSGWQHAWYSAGSARWHGQILLLQNGKEVWEISCDREESLLDALDKFAR